jgi:hypothetical protein
MENELCARFEQVVPERVNADSHFVWRGRNLSASCLVQIGTTEYLLRCEEGRINECRKGLPLMCSWDFALRGSIRAWNELWQDPPKPGWHDLFALTKLGEITMDGNLYPLMSNLQFFKDIITLPRKAGAK